MLCFFGGAEVLIEAGASFVLGGVAGGFGIWYLKQKWQSHLVQENQELRVAKAQLESEIKIKQEFYQEKEKAQSQVFEKTNETIKLQFQELAQTIFEAKSSQMNEIAQKNLNQILMPLREQITTFGKSIEDKFHAESKDRFVLKSEIDRLILMNDRVAQETQFLSRALKGDNKFQGDWGEMILEKILEASGLREGLEFKLQETFQSDDGQRLRPDVMIYLPDGKHIIVDSKVSLKAFEIFQNTDQETQKQIGLSDHLKSIENHVQILSQKRYQDAKGVKSPDFVFMFVPIEAAYLLALSAKPDIGAWAWDKGVAIVTASTLFTSLRTVGNLWRIEKHNQNAELIAKNAGGLYDKFVGFIEEFEKMGVQIGLVQKSYDTAFGRLKEGRGNIIQRIEGLKELGAKTSKKISADLTTVEVPEEQDANTGLTGDHPKE